MTEIEVIRAGRVICSSGEHSYEPPNLREALASGRAVAGYCSYVNARSWAAKIAEGVPHEVWYTERNGDPITLVVPVGTHADALPSFAMDYAVAQWIRPEDDFGVGVGVVPVKYRRTAHNTEAGR